MTIHKGYKAALLAAMSNGRILSIADAAEIIGKDSRREVARILNRGARDGWWQVAGERHGADGSKTSQRRFGTDRQALAAYAEATAKPKPVPVEGSSLNRKVGAILGAVRDLDGIKARCKIDGEGDCWTWLWSCERVKSAPHGRVGEQNLSMVRLAYQFATGKKPTTKQIVWRTCCNRLCLNPDHLKCGTRAQHGQWVKQHGNQRGNIERIVAIRSAASTRRIVTSAIVEQILLSDKSKKQWANELGVNVSSISRALKRSTAAAPNSSVFAWRPAA